MTRDAAADSTLRHALRANAAFSALSAAALLLGSGPLADILGIPRSLLLGVGVGLGLFVVDLLVTAARRPIPRKKAWYFITLDVLWVVGSGVALLVPTPLTSTGRLAVAVVALVVAGLAASQYRGTREAFSGRDGSAEEAAAGASS